MSLERIRARQQKHTEREPNHGVNNRIQRRAVWNLPKTTEEISKVHTISRAIGNYGQLLDIPVLTDKKVHTDARNNYFGYQLSQETRHNKTNNQSMEAEGGVLLQCMKKKKAQGTVRTEIESEDQETQPKTIGDFAYWAIRENAAGYYLVIGGDSKGKMMYVWSKDREGIVGSQHLQGNEHIHLINHGKGGVDLVYTYKPLNVEKGAANFGKEHANEQFTLKNIGKPKMSGASPETKEHLIEVASNLKEIVKDQLWKQPGWEEHAKEWN
ncbi:MAG: hypothetical protein HC936_02835 [Leptolyngbyaceae cyanobacterium SU_3_3]|nr:hypothetical protein [Leptolyngbyaceae cyanobacterium SU_3_3]